MAGPIGQTTLGASSPQNQNTIGDIVSLRSGGPAMTVSDISGNSVTCVYYNTITGLYEKASFWFQCLRTAGTQPTAPYGVAR